MIKALGEKDGKTLWLFGLSRRNCENLLAGKPIVIDLDVLAAGRTDPPASSSPLLGSVLLVAGEDEQAIYDQLRECADFSVARIKKVFGGVHATSLESIAEGTDP